MMSRFTASLIFSAALYGAASSWGQTIIYVDDSAPGANDGASWTDAYRDLQDGLGAAQYGDEIHVAQGTYTPDGGSGDRSATFQLVNGVTLGGGYAGHGAPDPDKRDVALYESTLTGDLRGDDVGDLGDPSRNENAYHVVTTTGTDGTASLDGFVITAGNANGLADDDQDRGGGIYNYRGSPTIVNCTVMRNSAESSGDDAYGGGIYNVAGSPTLSDCTIAGNFVYSSTAYAFGGGMYNSGNATLTNCTFMENRASAFGAFERTFGGGIYSSGDVTLVNCTFIDNSAYASERAYGGGMYNSAEATLTGCAFRENLVQADGSAMGGGMYNSGACSILTDCTFDKNSANGSGSASGGGMSIEGDSSPMLISCRFRGNSANGSSHTSGGGIYIDYRCQPTLINCILSGNSAIRGGGICNHYYSSTTLTNCTLTGNSATEGGGVRNSEGLVILTNCILRANGGSTELHQLDGYEGWTLVDYSAIQGLTGTLGGTGNIGDDPMFVDADGPDDVFGTPDDDVRLLPYSPCIDAGNSSADVAAVIRGLQPLPSTDLPGNPRFVEIVDVPDTGVGTFPIVDMGAVEHIDDCNGNGVPDEVDISIGTSEDCNGNGIPEECEADCNDNGIPDACEDECNGNGIPDDCEIAAGISSDCNGNGVPDSCDLAGGTSDDCTGNGVPDECEVDCNGNGIADSCDVADGTSPDCNQDGIPDECLTYETDCNANGLVDECETAAGITPDANENGLPDECEPPVLFVDEQAAGLNNGTTWANAFNDLQDAFAVAADSSGFVEEIWVAAGTYKPGGSGDSPVATFQLARGVRVYGGFAGDESNRRRREPHLHETILSGDLNGDDDPDPISNCCTAQQPGGCDDLACQITVCAESIGCCTEGWDEFCAQRAVHLCCDTCGNVCDNAYHVVTAEDTDETTLLDGFVVRDGYARGEGGNDRGAGMLIVGDGLGISGGPVTSNCTFADNIARYGGGGMYTGADAAPTVVQCAFRANAAHYGGGMLNRSHNRPTLVDCSFAENAALIGGGMMNWDGSSLLDNCTFRRNFAGGGGGMCNLSYQVPTLTGCAFAENRAEYGGGLYNHCLATPTLSNCVFLGNLANTFGGAICNDLCVPRPGELVVNSTFAGNWAGVSGGAVFNRMSDGLTLINSVFWGNEDGGGADESGQVHIEDSTASIDNCCIEGWTGQLGGTGNMGHGPDFVDADGPDDLPGTEDDNVRLSPGSPCINAGDNDAVPDELITDLDGHARILCAAVDMGAFEFGIGDYECDEDVDLDDFAAWEVCMTGPDGGPYDAGCEAFDFDFNGDVDLHDFAWLQGVLEVPVP